VQLDQLRLFIAVAAAGSFSRAATLVGSTQSSVSKRLLAFERELRCRLFERTGRGARLTDAGRILLPRAEALVSEADNLGNVVAEAIGQPRGTVRFAVQQSVSWPLVGHLHERVRSAFPNIKLQLSEAPMNQIDEWLRDGRVDLALVSRLTPDARADAQPLLADVMHLVSAAGDSVTRKPTIPFARLPSLPLILAALSNAGRVLIEEEARRRRLKLDVALELDSLHLIKRLVASGAGYAVATRHAVAAEIAAGSLSASKIVRPQIRHPFYLAFARSRESAAAVRVVADLVREAVRLARAP
jgi:LysR family transcriptional regulator, nitrogen assimilation regulatory protein